jgi:hypothetical protein
MLKLAEEEKMKWAELKRGWLGLAIAIVLMASPNYVSSRFGPIWGLAAAALAIPLWLVIRPWRFGLLSVETREYLKGWMVGLLVFLLLFRTVLFLIWHAYKAA